LLPRIDIYVSKEKWFRENIRPTGKNVDLAASEILYKPERGRTSVNLNVAKDLVPWRGAQNSRWPKL
jgi:hypothetical protein